jgi:leucyl-tRNA synthetase
MGQQQEDRTQNRPDRADQPDGPVDGYDPRSFEPHWVDEWDQLGLYAAPEVVPEGERKLFVMDMFPYPSGDLHIGHVENYTIADVMARYSRMRGMDVLHPMGYDAFGLPAENAALKRGIHPREWTYSNIEQMRASFKRFGLSFDWSREVVTCEPDYYRWNQWLFLKFYERGLAYRKTSFVNWCPVDKTVLAKEQLSTGVCWRCGSVPEIRQLPQWFLKITAYSDRLLDDMDQLRWSESVLRRQRNWIGRQTGAEVGFGVRLPDGGAEEARVFTTRPDTGWGATFLALAPEHPLAARLVAGTDLEAGLLAFVDRARRKGEVDRVSGEGGLEGMRLPGVAVNPFDGREIPVWVADYVLVDYGTGAVMGVPAHDQRDLDFARQYGLPVEVVIEPKDGEAPDPQALATAYTGAGTMVRSGPFDGTFVDPDTGAGIDEVIAWLEREGHGRRVTNYRQRDWLVSRQRYWGTPIPIVYCEGCGEVPVPYEDLPVLLPPEMPPAVDDAEGLSPLAAVHEWVEVACPRCGGPARRDTDTLDTFFDSSWYFLRYCDPHADAAPFDTAKVDSWCPVDYYVGGTDHAVMHLIYARFFVKFLYDLGMLGFTEPFLTLFNQGWITFAGGQMSKSKGSPVTAANILETYGADTGRVFILFSSPPQADYDFPEDGLDLIGRVAFNWLARVWRILSRVGDEPATEELERAVHMTVRGVTEDLDEVGYNTAIAKLMELVNEFSKLGGPVPRTAAETFLKLLAPIAPFVTEELWHRLGHDGSIHAEAWPAWDESMVTGAPVTLVVQVNGKVRDRIEIPPTATEDEIRELALRSENVRRHLEGREPKRVVVRPPTLVNFVA